MINKIFLVNQDGYDWYSLESDTKGKAILQMETGTIYGSVAMREDDPHTYIECDDLNYNPNEELEENID